MVKQFRLLACTPLLESGYLPLNRCPDDTCMQFKVYKKTGTGYPVPVVCLKFSRLVYDQFGVKHFSAGIHLNGVYTFCEISGIDAQAAGI